MRSARLLTPVVMLALAVAGALTPGAVAARGGGEVGSATAGDPYFPDMGDGGYRVRHYAVHVRYDVAGHRLTGDTTVRSRALIPLRRFDLDLRLPASAVWVDGRRAAFHQRGRKLIISPARTLAAGHVFRTRVRYAGYPAKYGALYLDGGWQITSDGSAVAGEPQVAEVWFPSNDHPTQKAPFDLYVTTDAAKQVVSNGSLVDVRPDGDVSHWHWRMARPMASYLAYADIGDFRFEHGRSATGIPYLYAIDRHLGSVTKTAVASLRQTPRIVDYYTRVFGPYRFGIVGGTLVNATFPFSLENQTRPQYTKEFFTDGIRNDGVIAHELAHMWFGDNVSVHRWRDVWLNEGFASFAEWLWFEHAEGDPARDTFASDFYDGGFPASFWKLRIGDPGRDHAFDGAVYERGAMTLQALRDVIGDRAFFTVLRRWNHQHAYANGSIAQFERLAHAVSGKDLHRFFRVWLFTDHKPAATRANGVPPRNSARPAAPRPSVPRDYSTRLPSSSQCAATFLEGCTRGGSPGILG